MSGRNFQSPAYRYGFNGKEKDDETQGSGNTYDYGARIYNSRLGRFLSTDPLSASFPWYSPYLYAGNKPIRFIDLDGTEESHRPITVYYANLNNVGQEYIMTFSILQMRAAACNLASSQMAANMGEHGYLMTQFDVVVDEVGGAPYILEHQTAKSRGEYFFDVAMDALSVIPGVGNAKSMNGPVVFAVKTGNTTISQEIKRTIKSIASTYNNGKHITRLTNGKTWKDIVAGTKSGFAKFKPGIDADKITIEAWDKGTKVTNGKDWKVMKFDNVIGAKYGSETQYLRVERTVVGNEEILHSHPILKDEYDRLIKN